jgi:hypothetical protein
MMQIPYNDVNEFLEWTNKTTQQQLTYLDFPMSSKIYGHTNYDGPESGMFVSFTTIVPGSGPNKDPYWTIGDAHKHLTEASYIIKWLHRRNVDEYQPEIHVIFDGSSNHTARPFDALHVGGGICRGPGGANAPGAPFKQKEGNKNANHVGNRMKMRDGWYINKRGERITQSMHRLKTMFDDNPYPGGKKAIFNKQDGLIFKGVEAILKESEECEKLVACDGQAMPFRCSPARRRVLLCTSNKRCIPGKKCCMHNTLTWRPDFCEQKCKLEEVCEEKGVKFHLLPICHPELNPIEGIDLVCCQLFFSSSTVNLTLRLFSRLLELYKTLCAGEM